MKASEATPSRKPLGASPGSARKAAEGDSSAAATVHPIKVYSEKDLAKEFETICTTLRTQQADWSARLAALRRLEGLVLGGAHEISNFQALLKTIRDPILAQLSDLRSAIIRQACQAITTIATTVGPSLDVLAESWLPALLKLSYVTIQVISESGTAASRAVVTHVVSARVLPKILDSLSDRSSVLRAFSAELLLIVLREWPSSILAKYVDAIEESIQKSLGDANPDARSFSRQCFAAYYSSYPDRAQRLLSRLDVSSQRLLVEEVQKLNLDGDNGSVTPHSGSFSGDTGTDTPSSSASTFTRPNALHSSYKTPKKRPTGAEQPTSTPSIRSGSHDTLVSSNSSNSIASMSSLQSSSSSSLRRTGLLTASKHSSLANPATPMSTKRSVAGLSSTQKPTSSRSASALMNPQSTDPAPPSYSTSLKVPRVPLFNAAASLSSKSSASSTPSSSAGPSPLRSATNPSPHSLSSSSRLRTLDLSSRKTDPSQTPSRDVSARADPLPSPNFRVSPAVPAPTQPSSSSKPPPAHSAGYTSSSSAASSSSVPRDLTVLLTKLTLKNWLSRYELFSDLLAFYESPRSAEVIAIFDRVIAAHQQGLADPHFKVVTMALASLEALVRRYRSSADAHLDRVLPRLFLLVHDPKDSVRQGALAAISAAEELFAPEVLLPKLGDVLDASAHSKVRAPALDCVMRVLAQPRTAPYVADPHTFKAWVDRLTACVEDKSADVRKASSSCLDAMCAIDRHQFLTHLLALPTRTQAAIRKVLSPLNPRLDIEIDDFLRERQASSQLGKAAPQTPSLSSRGSPTAPEAPPEAAEPTRTASPKNPELSSVKRSPSLKLPSPSSASDRHTLADRQGADPDADRPNGPSASADADLDVLIPEIVAGVGPAQPMETRRSRLQALYQLSRDDNPVLWIRFFPQILFLVLSTLKDDEVSIREAGMTIFSEMLQRQTAHFVEFVEVVVPALLQCLLDSSRMVADRAELSLDTLLATMNTARCIQALRPSISQQQAVLQAAALKLISRMIATLSAPEVLQHVDTLLPSLVQAFNSPNADVRRAVVLCLVELYVAVGESFRDMLAPHLTTSQLKLVTIYVNKRFEAKPSASPNPAKAYTEQAA